MSFSDEDLKRLKEAIDADDGLQISILINYLPSLLARMEAAENFRKIVIENWRAKMPQELISANEAWLRTTGKEG